ncbi:hypothetical protein F183_A11680 [Bryobacterales bacterium F-183]|nr:hypothetical protein F183_A11680 [Bryobacterales bacterium F-183]
MTSKVESARLAASGRFAQSRAAADLELASGNIAALQTLGVLALHEGRAGDAVQLLRRACREGGAEVRPSWFQNLAAVQAKLAAWDEMLQTTQAGLFHFPDDAALLRQSARAQYERRDLAAAAARYQDAVRSGGELTGQDLLRWAEAIYEVEGAEVAVDKLQDWLQERPDFAEGHTLLADILDEHGHATDTAKHRQLAHACRPDDDGLAEQLAYALWQAGDAQGFYAIVESLIAKQTASRQLHSFYLATLLHHDGMDAGGIRNAHEQWAARFAPSARDNLPLDRNPGRRLRIGYLGIEFHQNQSYYFLAHLLRYRDAAQYEIFIYDLAGVCDYASLECEGLADHWRRMRHASDDELVDTIRRDQLDILVDTSGHYSNGRTALFSRGLAPLQVRIPNYPSTLGMSCFDAILADRWVCPEGTENQYSERKVLRVAGGYMAYNPRPDAPPPGPLPMLRNGFATFGMFQRIQKMTSPCWDAIAAVLRSAPTSKLLIHTASSDLMNPESFERELYARALGDRGIDATERLVFAPPEPMPGHLRAVAQCDVALDTFPYNGQTTTCECLWMGVPVVSLHGDYHVSRIGNWVLDRAGFGEWCAKDVDEYVRVATSLVQDVTKLAALRETMRDKVARSLLTDGPRIAQDTEACYRQLWQDFCNEQQGEHVDAAAS